MSPLSRINLLQPRRLGRPRSRWQPLLAAIGVALVLGAAFGAGMRWFAGIQLTKSAAESWLLAAANDLRQVPVAERPALEAMVRHAAELRDLGWASAWQSITSSRIGLLLSGSDEVAALNRRRAQVEVDLRGGLEALNSRLEEIGQWPPGERAATLRLLSLSRWRLLGGSYEAATDYYARRLDEIARRPTATPIPTATVTATPTSPRTRGRAAPPRAGGQRQ